MINNKHYAARRVFFFYLSEAQSIAIGAFYSIDMQNLCLSNKLKLKFERRISYMAALIDEF